MNDAWEATAKLDASDREREILASGGKLPFARKRRSVDDSPASADD